jgi:hypothetical protein
MDIFRYFRAQSDVIEPLIVREVTALLKYASERGTDPVGTAQLYKDVQKLQAASPSPTGEQTESADTSQTAELRASILQRYAELAKLTYPVTGRTIVQTDERFHAATRPLRLWTLLFLFLAIGNEILKAWLSDIPEPEEGWLLHALNLRRYVLEYCAPFFWGALGSMAYLLKRLTDVAEDRTFDTATSHGWTTRIFLGAMLGGIIQFIYDPALILGDGEQGHKVTAIALGFLTGVGVKVVYGAIEKTIDVLASKLNLEAIRTSKTDTASIRSYLNDQLNKADKQKEPEKRKFILAMIDDVQAPKKSE